MKLESLIQGCIKNDRICQEQLYRLYFEKMFRFVMRYAHTKEEGLEIVNNGFLKIFQKLDKYSYRGSFEGWVRTLIYHAISDYYKKKSNNYRFIELEDFDKGGSDDVHEKIYAEDILILFDELPDITGKVLSMYVLEGYKHHEIAEQLNIAIGTSKWHLSEARKQLKKMILEKNRQESYGRLEL